MENFNDLLVQYLRLYGELVRYGEQEARSVQYTLEQLAKIIESQDSEALNEELLDLKETIDTLY